MNNNQQRKYCDCSGPPDTTKPPVKPVRLTPRDVSAEWFMRALANGFGDGGGWLL